MKRMPLRRVKLTEIPLTQRKIAARVAMREATCPEERAEILIAAMFPSDKTYFVAADAAA